MALRCKKCGSTLEKDAKFCIVCGEENDLVKTPLTEPPVNLVQPQQVVQNQQVEQQVQQAPVQTEQVQPQNIEQVQPVTVPPAEQEIIIPEASIKDTVVNTPEETNNSELQNMPDFGGHSSRPPRLKMEKGAFESKSTTKKKKRNDKKLIYTIAAIGGGIFVLIVLGFVFAFYSSYKNIFGKNRMYENSATTYRVGTKEFGFLTIPNSWVKFNNSNSNTLQYTDGAGWIVTLFAMPSQQLNAKAWSDTIQEQMKTLGADNISKEEAKVDKYSSIKISGFYSSANVYLSAWVMDAEDGYTHYIAIEGPQQNNDNYNIVNTFKITE